MADYHAVLQRTLAGFSDPKPQLRTKLYERARSTIQRQLEGRTPPITGEALEAELTKLEEAIVAIETSYDPSFGAASEAEALPSADELAGPMEEALPVAAAPAPEAEYVAEVVPEPPMEPGYEEPVAPVSVSEPEPAPAPAPEQAVFDAAQELQIPMQQDPAVLPDQPSVEAAVEQLEAATHQVEQELPTFDPPVDPVPEQVVEPVAAPPNDPAVDPLDQWAKEFLDTQPQPLQADVAAPPALEPVPSLDGAVGQESQSEADLSIPPAPGFSERVEGRRKRGGFFKWLFLLILLGGLAVAGYFGWTEREQLIERFGLSEMFESADNPIKPKPVKTISIKPEPAETEEETAPKPDVPKVENRLTPDGREVVQPESTGTDPVVLPPSASQATTDDTSAEPATQQGGTLPISQRAILYEEGSTAAENTVDSGRIIWSVVQEEPAAGEPKEPAIRGRVEIPSRNVVLIMTIKRNADRALPASHLIELVFAVPDDFSGGSIGQINRFVLKESEQGRGEGLVAVPARIADGIFLIALNNLEQAVTTNEQLLQQRNWIDIPMQYRTGRRALITIEKGTPGEAVFKEVFEAWKQK